MKIKGFEYDISRNGSVTSLRSGKKIKPYTSMGYLKVDLYNNCVRRKAFVHQLVGECFKKQSYFKGAIINHKDGNRLNNSLSNIEWCTHAQNNRHSYRVLGRICPVREKGEQSHHAKKIKQISLSGDIIKVWGSIVDAQNEYGQSIERCLSGRNKTSYGYKWKYA